MEKLSPLLNSCPGAGYVLPALIALAASTTWAAPKPITDLLPADSLVVYIARPDRYPSAPAPASQPASAASEVTGASAIAQILAFLSASGLVAEEGQALADAAVALPLLGEFEHCIALLDVSCRVLRPASSQPDSPDRDEADVSLRLDKLQCAIVFRTAGRQRAVLDQLNRIIGRYTNAEVANLHEQSVGDYKYQRLVDSRLPVWATWEWGRIDDFFVVCFGDGAFEAVAKAASKKSPRLSDSEWFRSASVKTDGDQALVQGYIALADLEKRLGEAASRRYARVLETLGAEKMSHDMWTIGLEGRALCWYRCFRRDDQDFLRRYSDPKVFSPEHRRIIPETAGYYAVIKLPTRWLVDNLPRAWVAARSDAETWARIWQRLEEETGVDLDGNLINHLGQNVIVFDYPPHPLRIPFAVTIAFEIDSREPVQVAVNALLTAWSRYLDDRAKRSAGSLVRVKVLHAQDGVWYLQAGILGPALKVTDRYVVLSWSPQALREALRFIEQTPAQ